MMPSFHLALVLSAVLCPGPPMAGPIRAGPHTRRATPQKPRARRPHRAGPLSALARRCGPGRSPARAQTRARARPSAHQRARAYTHGRAGVHEPPRQGRQDRRGLPVRGAPHPSRPIIRVALIRVARSRHPSEPPYPSRVIPGKAAKFAWMTRMWCAVVHSLPLIPPRPQFRPNGAGPARRSPSVSLPLSPRLFPRSPPHPRSSGPVRR